MEYGTTPRAETSLPPPHYQAAPSIYAPPPPSLSRPLPLTTLPSYSHHSAPNPNSNSSRSPILCLHPPAVVPYAPLGVSGAHPPAPYGYSQVASSVGAEPAYYGASGGTIGQLGTSPFSYGLAGTHVGIHKIDGLQRKMQKLIEGGAAVDSLRVCTICNVVCNGDQVFSCHLAGGKHVVKAQGTYNNGLVPSVQCPVKLWANKVKHPTSVGAMKKSLKGASKVVQSVYCNMCKIECNSQEVLDNHKMGKKHKRMLQKLQESLAPKSMCAPTTSVVKDTTAAEEGKALGEQTQKKKGAEAEEDLETKKRKVIEGGAVADAVRVCTLCNVVCNSETVFKFHVSGQRHTSMVKKQEEAVAVC